MTASNLSADWLTTWQQEITATLETTLRSFEDTFAYPPGDNEVFLADEVSRSCGSTAQGGRGHAPRAHQPLRHDRRALST